MYIKTKPRELILKVTNNTKNPLSAQDIQKIIGVEVISLATVYRNLDFFTQKGVLGKITLQNTHYYYDNLNHLHIFTCIKCLKQSTVPCDNIKIKINFPNAPIVTNHNLSLVGICFECQ